MALMDSIKQKAKANVKHIVLAEGTEPRTVEAAGIIAKEGLAKVTLLGDPEEVNKVAAGKSLEGVNIIDPEKSDKFEDYAKMFYELRKAKGHHPWTSAAAGKGSALLRYDDDKVRRCRRNGCGSYQLNRKYNQARFTNHKDKAGCKDCFRCIFDGSAELLAGRERKVRIWRLRYLH